MTNQFSNLWQNICDEVMVETSGKVMVVPGGRYPLENLTLQWGDLGYLVLGVIFLAMGVVTFLLTVLRAASRHRAIFLFAGMSLIWGLRFLIYTGLFGAAWPDAEAGIPLLARSFTYFGGATAFGFAWAYLGAGWRRSLAVLTWISLGFAILGSAVLLVDGELDRLLPVFNVLVVGGAILVVVNLLIPPLRTEPQTHSILGGVAIAAGFFILENLRALGLVPLGLHLEWVGVLILYLTLGRLIAIQLFTSEARLAAVQQELETARSIQASLLPTNPTLAEGIGMSARYQPMTVVPGVMYDVIRVGPHQQGFLVADVSGHGVPAAMIASMAKGAFRAEQSNLERPESVLAGMNRLLTGQLGSKYVTACCLFVDSQEVKLRFA